MDEFSPAQWNLVLIGIIASAYNGMFLGIDLSEDTDAAMALLKGNYPRVWKFFERLYNLKRTLSVFIGLMIILVLLHAMKHCILNWVLLILSALLVNL